MISNYGNKNPSKKLLESIRRLEIPNLDKLEERFGLTHKQLIEKIETHIIKTREAGKYETITDNSPKRQALREKCIEGYIETFSSGVQERKAILMIGPPAAGKTTLVNKIISESAYTVVDPDIIKTGHLGYDGLREDFAQGVGEDSIYKEVVAITNEIMKRLTDAGENIIIPKVGLDKEQIEEIARNLQFKGYSTELYLMDLPIEQSALRNISRFLEGQQKGNARFVDLGFLTKSANNPYLNFCSFYCENGRTKLFTDFKAYSNDVPMGKRAEPIEVETMQRVKEIKTGVNNGNNGND